MRSRKPRRLTEVPCPEGTYAPYEGTQSVIGCQKCFPGTFNPLEGQSACTDCPAGNFTEYYGNTSCTACPAHGFCPNAGAGSRTVWEPCPAGRFTAAEVSGLSAGEQCDVAPKGYFGLEGRRHSCPAGTSSTPPYSPMTSAFERLRPRTSCAASAGLHRGAE